jgi:hypothetical protein
MPNWKLIAKSLFLKPQRDHTYPSLVADAVIVEPVSTLGFPDTRQKTGNSYR